VFLPRPTFPEAPAACLPEKEPTSVLELPVIRRPEQKPKAVLSFPVEFAQRASKPIAVFLTPVVLETRALHPKALKVAVVQPRTIPATVGVAAVGVAAVIHSRPEAQAEFADRN
jgi:hypothetical protein